MSADRKPMKSSPRHLFFYQAQKMFNPCSLNKFTFPFISLMTKDPHFQHDSLSDGPEPSQPVPGFSRPRQVTVHILRTGRYKKRWHWLNLCGIYSHRCIKNSNQEPTSRFPLGHHGTSLTHMCHSSIPSASPANTDSVGAPSPRTNKTIVTIGQLFWHLQRALVMF